MFYESIFYYIFPQSGTYMFKQLFVQVVVLLGHTHSDKFQSDKLRDLTVVRLPQLNSKKFTAKRANNAENRVKYLGEYRFIVGNKGINIWENIFHSGELIAHVISQQFLAELMVRHLGSV